MSNSTLSPETNAYDQFVQSKIIRVTNRGRDIDRDIINPKLFPFQKDLVKWAMKAQPWVSAELAADAFELAHVARTVDMRASPYDFSAVGLKPIAIETAEGRGEYEAEQRRLSALAEPVRARLIAELDRALA